MIDGNQEEQAVYEADILIQTINRVIEKAEFNDIPIVFVRDLDVAEGQGEGFEIHREIKQVEGAVVVDKLATNSFYQTELLTYLQQQQIEHLVIMGCKTEHCVDTAVRTATVLGFDVTLVEDGHSTNDSSILNAASIIAHHNQVLHGHFNVDYFSIVRSSTEDLFAPTHNEFRL